MDTPASKIGELWNLYRISSDFDFMHSNHYLVGEHPINSLLLQEPVSTFGVNAVVQQGCDDLAVFCRLCETACPAGVESGLDFFWCLGRESLSKHMAVSSQ